MPFDYSRGLPPATDYAAEQEDMFRQQQLARLLQQQGMQSPQGGMAGKVYVGPSITQGLAQMMQSYAGGKLNRDVSTQRQGLADKRGAALAEAMKGFGQPQTVEAPAPSPEAVGPFQGQEQPYDYAGGIAKLAQIDPQAVAYGQAIMSNQERTREHDMNRKFLEKGREDTQAAREADRIARAEDAMARAREAQAGRKDLQDERFAQQRSMAQLAAGLRQPPQPRAPVMIQDPNDPTQAIYADPSQAIGKRAFNSKTATGAGAAEYAPPEGYKAVKMPKPLNSAQLSDMQSSAQAADEIDQIMAQQKQLYDVLSKKYPRGVVGQGSAWIAAKAGTDKDAATFLNNRQALINASLLLEKGVQTKTDETRKAIEQLDVGMPEDTFNSGLKRMTNITARRRNNAEAQILGYALIREGGAEPGAGGQSASGKVKTGAGGLSPEEQAELDALRKRFGK